MEEIVQYNQHDKSMIQWMAHPSLVAGRAGVGGTGPGVPGSGWGVPLERIVKLKKSYVNFFQGVG